MSYEGELIKKNNIEILIYAMFDEEKRNDYI